MVSSRVFLRVALGIAVLFFYCSPLLANSVSCSLNGPQQSIVRFAGGRMELSLNNNGTICCHDGHQLRNWGRRSRFRTKWSGRADVQCSYVWVLMLPRKWQRI